MAEFYNKSPDPWDLIEARRAWQEYRVFAITMGDVYVELARCSIHNTRPDGMPNIQRAGTAAALLVKACQQYQEAGLGRRAAVAWRYARLLHAARSRGAA